MTGEQAKLLDGVGEIDEKTGEWLELLKHRGNADAPATLSELLDCWVREATGRRHAMRSVWGWARAGSTDRRVGPNDRRSHKPDGFVGTA